MKSRSQRIYLAYYFVSNRDTSPITDVKHVTSVNLNIMNLIWSMLEIKWPSIENLCRRKWETYYKHLTNWWRGKFHSRSLFSCETFSSATIHFLLPISKSTYIKLGWWFPLAKSIEISVLNIKPSYTTNVLDWVLKLNCITAPVFPFIELLLTVLP